MRREVRSLILPKNGLATMASKAPAPATSARLLGASSMPTSEFTFIDKETSRGARNSRMVPMYASAYMATNAQLTRSTAGGRGTTGSPRDIAAGVRASGMAHSSGRLLPVEHVRVPL
jgi:hypothetical protein